MKEFHLESIAGVVHVQSASSQTNTAPLLDNIDPVVSPFASSAGGHLSNNDPRRRARSANETLLTVLFRSYSSMLTLSSLETCSSLGEFHVLTSFTVRPGKD